MKRFSCAIMVALLLFASAAFGQDYDGALKAAKRENKPLLLYFFSRSCPYCGLMDKKTLADKDIAAVLKRDFIFLRIDVDSSTRLDRLYRVSGTPSSWFVEPTGKRIGEVPGYVEARTYRTVLDYVKGRHYEETDLDSYLKKGSPRK